MKAAAILLFFSAAALTALGMVMLVSARVGTEMGAYTDTERVTVFTPSIYGSVYNPTAGWNVSGRVFIWNRESLSQMTNFQAQSPFMLLTFSSDGRRIATGGSSDHFIRLWSVPEFRMETELFGHRGGVRDLAFTPDGQTLVSGSRDHTLKLWDLSVFRAWDVLRGHKEGAYSIAFSPNDEILASASHDGTVRLWRSLAPIPKPQKKQTPPDDE